MCKSKIVAGCSYRKSRWSRVSVWCANGKIAKDDVEWILASNYIPNGFPAVGLQIGLVTQLLCLQKLSRYKAGSRDLKKSQVYPMQFFLMAARLQMFAGIQQRPDCNMIYIYTCIHIRNIIYIFALNAKSQVNRLHKQHLKSTFKTTKRLIRNDNGLEFKDTSYECSSDSELDDVLETVRSINWSPFRNISNKKGPP
jgi:hypothetical protein